jgi:hypothetical protein
MPSKTAKVLVESLLRGWGALLGVLAIFLAYFVRTQYHTSLLLGEIVPVVLLELGSVLFAVVIIHTAYENLLREHQREDVMNEVKKLLEDKLLGYSGSIASGFLAFYPDCLPSSRIQSVFKRSKEIKILKTFFQQDVSIEAGLEVALKNSATVELYLCDPNSPILLERCKTINVSKNEGQSRLLRAVKWMQPYASAVRTDRLPVTVTLHRDWPGPPIILCDQRILLGMYLHGCNSFGGPWAELRRDSDLGRRLEEQFRFEPSNITARLEVKDDFDKWITQHTKNLPRAS